MTPTFSILHATFGRPEKAMQAMKLWFSRASVPGDMEYIFACNTNDPTYAKLLAYVAEHAATGSALPRFVADDFIGSAPAWNAAAAASRGMILVQAQDDVEPPPGWDYALERRAGYNRLTPTVIAVSDGYRKDALLCTAICNRARYRQTGEFLHPEYLSVFSDDEFTVRALRDRDEGRCAFIDARDIVFRHEHHYHNPEVPRDATYARENSSEAYRVGAALFAKRNPWAAKYRTWA